MKGLKAGIAVLVVTAIAVTAGAALGQSGGEPKWETALTVRSEALNARHGPGQPAAAPRTSQAWLRALMIRSEALNEKYGLGKYARKPASATEEAWRRALMIRSDALNRQYKLGEYAPRR